VKQLLKSVVRQIRTLRSVGAGGGQLPPATRWAISNDRPYRDLTEHPTGDARILVSPLVRSRQFTTASKQSVTWVRNSRNDTDA
jgi:hypothetical protein